MRSHLVISDVQAKPGLIWNHLLALGHLIVDKKPDVIICIGDFWDFPSLSKYDEGHIEMEGRRVQKDIMAGNEAMQVLLSPLKQHQKTKACKKYKPKMIFCMGNHEHRLARHISQHPQLEGFLSFDHLRLEDWEVYNYLEVATIDGVHYSHFFVNPMTGRPRGGTMQNLLNHVGFSFTMGHVQKLDFGRKDLNNGGCIMGLVTGAYYRHNEAYKGPQGNNHWRGVVLKHGVKNGIYDLETFSLNRVLREYL